MMNAADVDDEIQYMGSRQIPRDIQYLGSLAPTSRQVTGIVLHANGEAMSFKRPSGSTSAILVGRRPPTAQHEKDIDVKEDDKAMFRCPVVSRRHAEITFGSNGEVYIDDLQSHHGTFLNSERIQRKAALNDGDIVTLGKTVVRNGEIVEPVLVRIEITHTPVKAPTFLPVFPPIRILSSGRYGLSTTSDDSDSSMSFSDDSGSEHEHVALPPITSSASFPKLPPPSVLLDRIRKFTAPVLSPSPEPPSDIFSPESLDASYNDIFEDEEQSFAVNNVDMDEGPNIIGAWPGRTVSPISETALPSPFSETPRNASQSKASPGISKAEEMDITKKLRQYKIRFNESMQVSKERFTALESRVAKLEKAEMVTEIDMHVGELSSLCTSLMDRMDGDIPDIQAQIELLQETRENSDVGKQAIKDLVDELRTMKGELERALACASASTLKRKRDDETDDDRDRGSSDVITRPVKKLRTGHSIAKMMVRTTATAAVGAVVAWGALAFY